MTTVTSLSQDQWFALTAPSYDGGGAVSPNLGPLNAALFFRERLAPMWLRLQQLWQPGKVRCDPSPFILRQQLGRRPPPWLILIVDVGRVLATDKIAARLRCSVTQRD